MNKKRKPTQAVKIGQDISLTHKKIYPEGKDGRYTWGLLPRSKWKVLK